MNPPQCVQNAMMTKDKKPFTYTPGGIDLSEVRSPRMQRRIERNANLGGASDMPKSPQPPLQNVGPLPPAALAALRPQTQVQVFPGPPPPPPMNKNIPPPPPPPTCPLPTQKVTTNENLVLERPDMTKIIPENPMTLLRKTGGPAPRKSLVDQMYEEQGTSAPAPPQRNFEAAPPRYQPPVVERPAPISPPAQQQRQSQAYQPAPQQYEAPSPPQNQYQPSYQPAQPQYQPPQPQYQPVQVQHRSTDSPKPSSYQPPIIERQPTLSRQDAGPKNVSSNVGTLYIPPLGQQQQKVVSPPTPPERNQPQVQSPGTPTLKEAPRPWQQKSAQQQQEIPSWAKKDDAEIQSPPSAPNMQQRWQSQASPAQAQQTLPQQQFSSRPPQVQQQSPRATQAQNQPHPSNSFPVNIEIRQVPYQQEPEPSERKPNAVYITQPLVLQHPGGLIEPPYQAPPKIQPQPQQQQKYQQQQQYQQPRQQVQQPKIDSSGARIIPIQIEGRTPPSTPGGERNLSRQLSWGTQPLQSNSFKVIQKITKTDDEDDDTPITQHSARYNQEMPEQIRKMKVDNGHLRQVPQQNNAGRNIAVQAEGNGQPQPYVHPSEQVVPEPKKYMGSNIPSRSFKILQAMTAPTDSCANAKNNEEIPYNPVYNPYSYPYFPPPYWPDYYTNFYPPEQSEQVKSYDKASTKGGRSTPIPHATPYPQPYWHDYYPNNYPQEQSDSTSKMSDRSSKGSSKSGRSTPVPMPPPYWGYMPSPTPYGRPRSTVPKIENTLRPQTPNSTTEYQQNQNADVEEPYHYPMYPPYFDPYYYSYYYGYPPMVPPYPYYPSSTENEEYSGYSSTDEMSNYTTSRKRRNSLENTTNSVQNLKQHFEVRSKSAAPRITITPTYSQENISFNIPPDRAKENLDETDGDGAEDKVNQASNLRSIKSVQNIHVYATREEREENTDSSESEESTENETDTEEMSVEHNGEEIIPHQLSVIFEESERADSRRSFRCNSVASEATTIAEHHSEEEDDDLLANQNVRYKINLFQETSETFISTRSVRGNSIRTLKEESESFDSFSFSSNSKVPQNNSHSVNDIVIEEVESDDSSSLSDDLETLCIKAKEVCDNSFRNNEDNKGVEESRESDEDFWGAIQKENGTDIGMIDKYNTTKRENECDKVNSKADSVMVEVGDEIVCVKLRNKRGRNISKNDSTANSNKETDDSFFSSVSQRDSVYDILKNNEDDEEEVVSGGILMRVDSFASQLEAIKRNSGLWNLGEEIGLSSSNNIIMEESFDSEEASDEPNARHEENNKNVEECNLCEEESFEEVANHSEGSEEIDFWSQIKDDDDDFKPRRTSYFLNEENTEDCAKSSSNNIESQYLNTSNKANDDSTNSSDRSYSVSHTKEDIDLKSRICESIEANTSHLEHLDAQETHIDSEESSETESSDDEEEMQQVTNDEHIVRNRSNGSRSKSLEPQTIKERINALKNSIAQKQRKLSDTEEIAVSVKSKVSAIEVPTNDSRSSKTASAKSSIRSFEEYSEEEEMDSGVISDISRHISDNEEFPELKKLTRYERAATHSRLFKLLQDECDIEEEEEEEDEDTNEVFVNNNKEDKFSKLSVRKNNNLSLSRSKLSLPLQKCNESDMEKRPQVNEKLVEELVQSLLKSKKAQVFRNMPKEKLYAAAVTILQEGIESAETPEEFSSLLSPLRGDTESSTPAQTPQEFYGDYNEYKQYYDSWSDAAVEIMPSKAFKLLQEHLESNKLGTIEGILAKCPRILSSKNIPKEILKLLDETSSDCSSYPSQNLPQSNDVTNT